MPSSPAARTGTGPAGFSLVEITIVLVIGAVMLTLAASTFSSYQSRSSARRAAQVFSRDLTLARSSARRTREPVVVRFYESSLWYTVTTGSGRELARRRFGGGGDLRLSAIDLEITGDSVAFDESGVAELDSATGIASFTAGTTAWEVEFNALGASRLAER